MTKRIIITCDRCGVELTLGNFQLCELYGDDHTDLCNDCFQLADMHAEAARIATVENRSVPDVVADILKRYD